MTIDPSELNDAVEMLEGMVHKGKTPDDAKRRMCQVGIPEAVATAALVEFEQRTNRIRSLKWATEIVDPSRLHSWYTGPGPNDRIWPALEAYLTKKGWGSELEDLDKASSQIVS